MFFYGFNIKVGVDFYCFYCDRVGYSDGFCYYFFRFDFCEKFFFFCLNYFKILICDFYLKDFFRIRF